MSAHLAIKDEEWLPSLLEMNQTQLSEEIYSIELKITEVQQDIRTCELECEYIKAGIQLDLAGNSELKNESLRQAALMSELEQHQAYQDELILSLNCKGQLSEFKARLSHAKRLFSLMSELLRSGDDL